MPAFDAIIGQERACRILRTMLARDSVPHALLFTGSDGIGKATTARAMAMALNCPSPVCGASGGKPVDACGTCRNCHRILTAHHPDVLHLEPAGAVFRIGQVRALLATLAMKPYEARHRVVILGDAHTMTPAAGNALLKVLEEPPPRTVMILTAPQASDLLPTLVSRCQHIRFQPLSSEAIVALLFDHRQVDGEDAALIAAMSGGSAGRALALSQRSSAGEWRRRRDWLVAQLTGCDGQPRAARMAVAAELVRDGKAVGDWLELAKSWLRDLMVVRWRPDQVTHQDRIERLQALAPACNVTRLADQIRLIQQAQRALGANAAARLTVEALMLALARGGEGQPG